MGNIDRILDYVDKKKVRENVIENKQLDKIANNKLDKVIIREPIQCTNTKEDVCIQSFKDKVFNIRATKVDETQLDSKSIKSLIKDYVAEKLGVSKTKFKYEDNEFEDYGIKDSEFYHIFLVLDQNYVDYNIIRDVCCRLVMSEQFLEKQKIILFSILDIKIYIFEIIIEKDIIEFLRR